MTSELRPASEVWSIACGAYEDATADLADLPMRDMVVAGDEAAAAVIEADREAVRAEQAAELAKFKALAETLAEAVKVFMPTNINLRMPHPDDSFIVPLDVSMGELRALDAALRQYKEARDV